MAASINNFASSAYSQLSATISNEENLFFSPASIYVALSMTYCGARCKTAQQMKDVLKLNGEPDDVKSHESLMELWQAVTEGSENGAVSLDIANRLWLENSYTIKDEFQSLLTQYYKANAKTMDFKGNPEKSRIIINDWVAEQTKQKIKDLIPGEAINNLTKLVITNAIYFKGTWKFPFEEDLTKNLPFYTAKKKGLTFFTSKKKSHKVAMMFQKGKFGYVENMDLNCKALTMSYFGTTIQMTIILPNEINGLEALETKLLEPDKFTDSLQSLISQREENVKVFIPKFKFSQSCSVKEVLKRLDMTELLDEPTSDLSGISELNDLYVSEVIHKAFVEVNEVGTEAAAAAAADLRLGCSMAPPPTPIFKADHPFMFFIHDEKSNVILFMGRVRLP